MMDGQDNAMSRALQDSPILLEGVTGCGKTSLVDELARVTGNSQSLLKIHLGDQTDSKVLLGTYICTDVPGEFRWQAGVLTQAVVWNVADCGLSTLPSAPLTGSACAWQESGRWLVIEDIDLAPLDVLSILVPLLERRELHIPGRGEVVRAARGFQLFATQTLTASGMPALLCRAVPCRVWGPNPW
jgi:midasin